MWHVLSYSMHWRRKLSDETIHIYIACFYTYHRALCHDRMRRKQRGRKAGYGSPGSERIRFCHRDLQEFWLLCSCSRLPEKMGKGKQSQGWKGRWKISGAVTACRQGVWESWSGHSPDACRLGRPCFKMRRTGRSSYCSEDFSIPRQGKDHIHR